MADLLLSLIAKDEMSEVFGKASGAVLRMKDALADMVKQAAESEKIGKLLEQQAGNLTAAFQAQANVLSARFAVDDEHIQKMQTVLLRYGEAPGKVEATTKALLDYAAATGQDAASATEALVRGVEKGNGSIKALGVSYKATGEFTKDLALATEALGKRFGGSGDVAADTMEGRTKAVQISIDNLKESFGGFFILLESKVGALKAAAEGLRAINQAMSQGTLADLAVGAAKKYGGALNALNPLAGLTGLAGLVAGGDADTTWEGQVAYQNAVEGNQADALKKGTGGGKQHAVGKGGGGAADQQAKALEVLQEHMKDAARRAQEEVDRQSEAIRDRAQKYMDEQRKGVEAQDKELERAAKRSQEELDKIQREADTKRQHEIEKQAAQWARAGDRLGSSFVGAFVDQLGQLAGGGQFDVGSFFLDLLGGIFSFAADITGFGALNAIGRGATSFGKGLAKSGRHHEGAWIEQFHGGGWPAMGGDEQPAVLQSGERVLSRREVRNMGGRAGVDAAASGGGAGLTVNVQAVDQESVRQLFEGRGGRAMFNAVRLGRGPIGQLLKR